MSATTPTTVFQFGDEGPPSQQAIRLPSGLSEPNAARASVSLMIMTNGAWRVSVSVNVRPARNGLLITAKKPGVTKCESLRMKSPIGLPSTSSPFDPAPEISGARESSAANLTP